MTERLRIRQMTERDRAVWMEMYGALFPGASQTGMSVEIDRILNSSVRAGFCAEHEGRIVGFAEYNIREFANGCNSQPVPFLEGIWVRPDVRQEGVAAALMAHLENVARAQGFLEFGSDVLIDNDISIRMHKRLGFEETERVVYFRKDI